MSQAGPHYALCIILLFVYRTLKLYARLCVFNLEHCNYKTLVYHFDFLGRAPFIFCSPSVFTSKGMALQTVFSWCILRKCFTDFEPLSLPTGGFGDPQFGVPCAYGSGQRCALRKMRQRSSAK